MAGSDREAVVWHISLYSSLPTVSELGSWALLLTSSFPLLQLEQGERRAEKINREDEEAEVRKVIILIFPYDVKYLWENVP